MPSKDPAFAQYCCELLSASVGPCLARRMFGGWGISAGGMTIALVTDLGDGETLWLKADGALRSHYEAAGSRRFTYLAKGVERSVNYYSAPGDAMESPQLMAPWARQALDCALKAQSSRTPRPRKPAASATRAARPTTRRPAAPAPSTIARRRSAKG
ncbi:MAG: TfoX family protein [Comamonadaceae bacterium]|nr:MAG: TfoX family protein [Comamonadaceae bacterium]